MRTASRKFLQPAAEPLHALGLYPGHVFLSGVMKQAQVFFIGIQLNGRTFVRQERQFCIACVFCGCFSFVRSSFVRH